MAEVRIVGMEPGYKEVLQEKAGGLNIERIL